jgi:hypothetical protein
MKLTIIDWVIGYQMPGSPQRDVTLEEAPDRLRTAA